MLPLNVPLPLSAPLEATTAILRPEAPRSVPVLTMLPVKVPPLAVTFVAILMAEKCAVMAPVLVTPPEKFVTSFRTISLPS